MKKVIKFFTDSKDKIKKIFKSSFIFVIILFFLAMFIMFLKKGTKESYPEIEKLVNDVQKKLKEIEVKKEEIKKEKKKIKDSADSIKDRHENRKEKAKKYIKDV